MDMGRADAPATGPNIGAGVPLRLTVRLGYAAGDFGLNLYWNGMALFLAFFQTDVLGIPAHWVGLGFFLASLIDALADPLMGAWADRTSTRWGRYRPFILVGCVPLALAFTACFALPGPAHGGNGPLVLITAPMLGHLVLRLAYTVVSIPFSALSASITQDAGQRTSLTGWRMGGAFLGAVAVSYLMPALARGGPPLPGAPMPTGGDGVNYGGAAMVVGGLAVVGLLACTLAVREQPLPDGDRGAGAVSDIGGFLATLCRGGPLLRLLPAMMVIQLAVTMMARNLLYFFKYDVGDEGMAAWAVPLFMAASALSIPFWVWLSRRTSKRAAWQVGSAMAAVASLVFLPLPVRDWGPVSLAVALVALALVHVGTTVHAVGFWAMLPDLVDYNDWRFSRRDEGKIFGVASLAQKLALGVAGGILGLLMHAIGFVANQPQDMSTLHGLRLIMTLIPAACILAAMVIMRGYTITGQAHRRIIAELRMRAAQSRSSANPAASTDDDGREDPPLPHPAFAKG